MPLGYILLQTCWRIRYVHIAYPTRYPAGGVPSVSPAGRRASSHPCTVPAACVRLAGCCELPIGRRARRGRPPSPRSWHMGAQERWQSGRLRRSRKPFWCKPTGVRIPLSPRRPLRALAPRVMYNKGEQRPTHSEVSYGSNTHWSADLPACCGCRRPSCDRVPGSTPRRAIATPPHAGGCADLYKMSLARHEAGSRNRTGLISLED